MAKQLSCGVSIHEEELEDKKVFVAECVELGINDFGESIDEALSNLKGAISLGIDLFKDFPKRIDKIKHLKNKKIVMYCTGGIRCEKASAYLKEKGFKNVSQLSGGILTFGKEKPNSRVWEGKCFVFDNRVTSDMK